MPESIKDIIIAASGVDEYNETKSSIGLFRELWDNDGNSKRLDELFLDSPIINISRHGEYAFVDLKFATHLSDDLREAHKLIDKYYAAENSDEEEPEQIEVLLLSIVPHEYGGEFYFLCFNPIMWSLTYSDPSEPEPDTLRFVFNDDDFKCFQSEEPIGLEEIDNEVSAELRIEDSEMR